MSGNKCVYANCGNSKYRTKNLKMFSFPFKDSERCEKWKIFSGNADLLNLEEAELKSKYICEAHFLATSFVNITRHRLVHDAVPMQHKSTFETKIEKNKLFQESKLNKPGCSHANIINKDHWKDDIILPVLVPTKTYSASSLRKRINLDDIPAVKNIGYEECERGMANNLENFYCSPLKEQKMAQPNEKLKRKNLFDDSNVSPRKKKIIHLCQRKSQLLHQKNRQLQYLNKKLKTMNFRFETLPDFLKAQLNKKKITKWSQQIRDMAISIYYTSPAAYRCIKKHQIKLPGVSTIKKWLASFDFCPGFSKEVFAKIERSARNFTNRNKMCVLSFDELSIKKHLDYNKSKDIIEGFEDLGNIGRSAVMGDHALVFHVKSIFGNWKTAVAYFITANPIKFKNLAELVKKCLEALEDCGLNVKAIVCDQGSNNRSAMKQLGVKDGFPYFFLGNRKYYAFYDVPHLFKSIRNQLLQRNFLVDGAIVSWYDIKATFDIDSKSDTCKALHKLTFAHIKPNPWQKMRVKYAVQVFSNSMAAAIRTAVKHGQLHKPALNTALFIEKLDCMFDALNSRTRINRKKPYLRALSAKNSHVAKFLQGSMEWISSWKTVEGKFPPCFGGLLNTATGILSLYNDLKEEGIAYLPTRHLNQDCLENLFAFVRKRCGYERNPTARMMRLSLRAIINHNLKICIENTNCEQTNSDKYKNMFAFTTNKPKNSTANPILNIKINTTEIKNINLENCARKYTAGYVIKKCVEKFNCQECRRYLLCSQNISDKNDELIMQKLYYGLEGNRLNVPSKLATQVFSALLVLLNQNYQAFWAGRAVMENLGKLLFKTILEKYPSWNFNSSCEEHRRFIVSFTILIFLYKKTLWKSREARMHTIRKRNNVNKHQKLTILNHE